MTATFNYTKSQATALRLITKFGTSANIIRAGTVTGPDYDPTYGPDIEAPCTIVFSEYTSSEIDGTLVQQGDIKVLMAASGFAIEATSFLEDDVTPLNLNKPTPADRLSSGGKDYEIIDIKPLQPAGVVVMWKVQCRS